MYLEKRKTSRFPVLSLSQEGELRFGDIRMPVRLLDQSASGVAVMARQVPGVEIGSTGLLRAGEDWFKIRLIHVVPLEHPALEETSTPEVHGPCFRLGLFRLSDAVDPDKNRLWSSLPMLRIHLDNVLPVKMSTIGFGMLFVLVIIVMPVLTILFLQNSSGFSLNNWVHFTKRIAATNKPESNELGDSASTRSETSSISKAQAFSGDHRSENITSPSSLADFPDKLRNAVRGKPGASVFLMPEVASRLGITKKQEERLQEMVEATAEIVNELELRFNRRISPEQYQELLKMARENALQLLTDEQRAKWQILSGEKAQKKSVAEAKDDK